MDDSVFKGSGRTMLEWVKTLKWAKTGGGGFLEQVFTTNRFAVTLETRGRITRWIWL
jgi:hypothetical protein